jgi:ribosome-interacting GTPase 1
MPANLPPQYYELERAYKAEKDPQEKLRLAEELLTMMPKHKGTDKLQADMKSKISKLKKQISGGDKSHGARHVQAHDHIEKEGAAQIILIGPPNCGKSSLVDAMTHAKPFIADFPYSTREPLPGMTIYETVQLQLIDTPPISPDLFENYLSGLIRNSDLVVLVADLGAESMIEDLNFIIEKLKEKRIILKKDLSEKPDDVRISFKRTIICAHKEYEDEDGSKREKLKTLFTDFPMIATSILDDDSLEMFKKTVFESLNIIRIYTKPIGQEPDYNDPIIIPIGGTVEEAAIGLHRDFAHKLKFAKIWGEGKYDGQRVQKDYKLSDKDILEFHV